MDASTLLADLVAFPSVCGTPNGDIVGYIGDYLARHGIQSRALPGPEGDRSNLLATIGPADRPGYVLSGHLDVVSVQGQQWSSDPFKLTETGGGRYVGRGAVDMKGFVACVLAMAPEFAKMPLQRPIHIAFSYDEELGCRGVGHMLSEIGAFCALPAACIVGEPSEMRPVLSHKGKVALEVSFRGQAGHSSNPGLGENAIYPAAKLIDFIAGLARRMEADGPFDRRFEPPFSTLQVGTVHGGVAVNIIPEQCRIVFEVRTIPQQAADAVLDVILSEAARIEAAARLAGGTLEITSAKTAGYPALTPAPDPSFAALMARLTGRPALQSVSYGTEAGLYDQAGIPSIICGPGSIDRAHKPDEFILDAELHDCLAMLRGLGEHLSHA